VFTSGFASPAVAQHARTTAVVVLAAPSEYSILGPLEVSTEGRPVSLGGVKQRALLVILLLNANQLVSSDRLIDELWGEEPPPNASDVVDMYVSQLRKVLGDPGRRDLDVLVAQRPGYLIRVSENELDATRFAALYEAGHQALLRGEPAVASVKLREALSLWRGPALADFASESFAEQDRDRLHEQQLGALEDRFEADLELGRGGELVPELESAVVDNPLRERLGGQLMLALYRAGRRAEALEVYQGVMRRQSDEVGIVPSRSLQRLHERILRQDATLLRPGTTSAVATSPRSNLETNASLASESEDSEAVRWTPGAGVPGSSIAAGEDQLLPVTALFADVVGSTSLAERLTPEEVRVLIGDCISRISREVERFGGTVQAYMGDGICAYFGVPESHEDDWERAAMAALQVLHVVREQARQIEHAWGIPNFEVRIGVNAGRTLVGTVGAGNPQVVAFGDPINVAARLQTSAAPGTIVLGDSVAKRLGSGFSMEPLGDLKLKGRELPVTAWRLLGRLDEPLAPPSTPLVGRSREFERLETALADLLNGRGQVLLIRGDPGLGKSRIIAELRALAEKRCRWLEGRCAPYSDGESLGPMPQVVRSWIGAANDDPEIALTTKLRTRLDTLDASVAVLLTAGLGRVLGIRINPDSESLVADLSPGSTQSQAVAAFATWMRALSTDQPMILVIEDLHYADEQTLAHLDEIVPMTDQIPMLIVVSSRPEPGSKGWEFWLRCLREFHHRTIELSLEPLPESPALELMDALSPTGALDGAARSEILARAAGNPLYIEELVKALVELGGLTRHGRGTLTFTTAGLELPPALESLLVVRIQRLPPAARRLAQTAAVVGREFDVALLERVVEHEIEGDLRVLLRAEIVRETQRHPQFVCRFAHALIHEAALSTMTPDSVRKLAGAIANALDASGGDGEHHLERLAAYTYRAENLPRAMHYLERAAQLALEMRDDSNARRLLDRAERIALKIGDTASVERIRLTAPK
jgi:class 3 adenylate cyclase/DNA-binding winged helix-turn-helix (wHTH) protein